MTEANWWQIAMGEQRHNLQQKCPKLWWCMCFGMKWAGSAGTLYQNGVFGLLDGNSTQPLLVGQEVHVFDTGLLAALQVGKDWNHSGLTGTGALPGTHGVSVLSPNYTTVSTSNLRDEFDSKHQLFSIVRYGLPPTLWPLQSQPANTSTPPIHFILYRKVRD
jgi:hypothetical protein